ncbi:MAG: alpha/beta fold hydrolase, partial [Litorimonas sp.]
PRIRRAFVDGPFGQVHLRRGGEGSSRRPLLCLHQSPKSSREFAKILPHLATDRHVVAVDNPGHGESDLPGREAEATIEAYARSAWAAVDALGLGPVDLLGHHTGAKVATEMAFQRPDDVGAIVMISALVLTPEETQAFRDQFQEVPLDEAGTRFTTMWEKSVQHRGPGVSLEDLAASFAENLRAGEAYEWGHKAAFGYNVHFPDRVSALDHRIVVLNPADMLYDLTPRVAPLLKSGRVEDHPEWGFGFMDADTERAAGVIKEALS